MQTRPVAIAMLGVAVAAVGTFVFLNFYGAPSEAWLLRGGLDVSSGAFANGTAIPAQYTCKGEDISPPLSWGGYPPSARSIAIIMEDPDAPSGTFAHWILYNVRPGLGSVGSDQPDGGSIQGVGMQGTDDFGKVGYRGPCPPPGSVHHYRITVFALNKVLNMSPGSTRAELLRELMGHVVASGTLVGTFGLPGNAAGPGGQQG